MVRRDGGGYELALNFAYLFDGLDEQERMMVLDELCAHRRLMEMICTQVAASPEDWPESPPDVFFDSKHVGALREMLAPILGRAVADELTKARGRAAKAETAERLLRELASERRMLSKELSGGVSELHRAQIRDIWKDIYELMPEYAPEGGAA